jgi:hypothetical protein
MNECFGCGLEHSGYEPCETTTGDLAFSALSLAPLPLLIVALIISRIGEWVGAW